MTTPTAQLIKQYTVYREKFAPKANKLFVDLMSIRNNFFREKTKLRILVIGAGTFPSYTPLLQQLLNASSQLEEVHFTLVEPMKKLTDIFMDNFAQPKISQGNLQVSFTIVNESVAEFLKKYNSSPFHLIYFEHPETMTLPIVLAKLGWRSFRRVLTLRKSMPQLAKVLQPNTLIVASCMSQHELKQLKSLLKYSLGIQSQATATRNPLHYFFGGPFTTGLYGRAGKIVLAEAWQEQRARKIGYSDNLLVAVLLLSLIIYLFKLSDANHLTERTIAVLLMGAQMFLHMPGKMGLFIKIILLAALSALVLM